MITFEQALTCNVFHAEGHCTRKIGPRGEVKVRSVVYRRNGKTQTWKTRPNEFRIPVKYGLKGYDQIWHNFAYQFHTPEDCPLNETEGEV